MKKLQLVLVSLGLAISVSSFAQVALSSIGIDEIHSSAILHLESDINKPKGFLLPTMTNAKRLAIISPAEGLQVYVTDFEEKKGVIMFYNGKKWKALTELITCPDAPTSVIASVTDKSGEVEITFTPPNNRGSDIIFYKVTPISGGVTVTGTTTTTVVGALENVRLTVTGLAIGKSYIFTVTATNDVDTSLPSEPSNVVELKPKVGDFYQGGVVFYILTSADDAVGYVGGETHGLICALEDLDSEKEWSPEGVEKEVTGTIEKMGYGKTNTAKIIEKLGSDNKNYAAYQATLYDAGDGYQDWYLPSKHELNKIYLELKGNNSMGFKERYYWSSSEKGISDACRNHLGNNNQNQVSKSSTHLVRPVRSF